MRREPDGQRAPGAQGGRFEHDLLTFGQRPQLSESLLEPLAATTRLPDSHHSYRSIDREIKMPLYARHGVSYLWLIE